MKMIIGWITLITSLQNEQVKTWRKLHAKKYRNQLRCFLVEGYHLLEEAQKSGWEIETIIIHSGVTPLPKWEGIRVEVVNDEVFASLAQTETPQGVISVVKMQEMEKRDEGPILLLDAVQDPGNVGTMIRTADALGAASVIVGKGTVDLYNSKVIRATQGSLFHLHISQMDLPTAIQELQTNGVTVWASSLQEAVDLKDVTFTGKDALIVGNEGAGINERILQLTNNYVKIPIKGDAESLNVSIAAGILLYEMMK